MKKTIAALGSAAALTLAGAGVANAEPNGTTPPEGPSDIAEQLCGAVDAYDFLGSAVGLAPGLGGEECVVNADAAIEAAMSFDFGGALEILRGDVDDSENGGDDGEGEGDGDSEGDVGAAAVA